MLGDLLFPRRHARRSLASALIGEITATLEAIEGYHDIRRLKAGEEGAEKYLSELKTFELPPAPIYTNNITHLWVFEATLQRRVSYFYTCVASLAGHLHALSKPTGDTNLRKQYVRNAITEINNTMNAGDELLRALRPLVSRHRHPSITRA